MELADALAAEGIVCAVGAGGKKTAMAALAAATDRATVTATVRIPKAFADREEVARLVTTDDPAEAEDFEELPGEIALQDSDRIALVHPSYDVWLEFDAEGDG